MKTTIPLLLAFIILAPPTLHSAEVGKEGLLIDLSSHYTRRFDKPNYKGSGNELPTTNQVVDGLRFQLKGRLTLWSVNRALRGNNYPVSVKDLPVNAKFDELHLVHSGTWTEVDGRVVATVRLNYADGTKHDYPIKWGYHVHHWIYLPGDEEIQVGDPNHKFFWMSPNRNNTKYKGYAMLGKTHFMNPHADRVVRSIDLYSNRQMGAYSVVSMVAAMTDPSRPKTKPIVHGIPPRKFDGQVNITVKSMLDKKPIENATIQTSAQTEGVHVIARSLATDKNGEAIFRYRKDDTTLVTFSVGAPGFAPGYKSLRGTIDSSLEILLGEANSVGGVVVDDAGKPLPDVTVKMGHQHATLTDAEGKWTMDGQPVSVSRYPVKIAQFGGSTREFSIGTDVSAADLLAKKARLVLAPGAALSGIVRDEKGKPLENARVFFGKTYSDKSVPEVRTDKKGAFGFANLPRGKNLLTIRKWEMTPEIINVDIGSKNKPMEVTMKPGNALMVYVKDPAGKPIQDVSVTAYPARGPRTYQFRQPTKVDGSVFFAGLPDQPFRLYFTKEGLRRHSETLQPSITKPHQVVIGTVQTVRGRVVDAKTSKPVNGFDVTVGFTLSTRKYFHSRPQRFKNGSFEVRLENVQSNADAVLKVEAEGYLPALSDAFSPDSPPREMVISMKMGGSYEGSVILPNGQPASGAQVTMNASGNKAMIRDGDLNYYSSRTTVVDTDSDGRFKLNPQPEPGEIIVAHKEGFAVLPADKLEADQPIRLQRWGRFIGTLTRDGKPVANEFVGLGFEDYRSAPVSLQHAGFPLKTDARGQLELGNLPPGEYKFYRMIPGGTAERRSYTHADSIDLTIESGKRTAATIDLTLQFRHVTGKMIVPELKDANLSKIKINLYGSTMIKLPADKQIDGRKPRDEQQAKQGYITPQFELYAQADGTFSVKDMPTGRYRMHAVLESEENHPGTTRPRQLARLSDSLVVEPGAGSSDLGEFLVLPFLNIGDLAPAFTAETVDGEKFKLADFRGKYVLLDFWAVWCGPCIRETPNMKKIHEEFGSHPKFAMIGLSLDSDKAQPRNYARKNDLKWVNGYLGDWNSQTITKDFRVYGIPQIMLIGPDGKILAKDLRGDRIRAAITAAFRNSR